MNYKEELAPELEKLISKVRLKEPSRELMKDYLSGVNTKIDQGIKDSHFGFPQFAVFLVIGMALAGFLYFFLVRSQTKSTSNVNATTVIASAAKQSKIVLRQAQDPERSRGTSALLGTTPRNDKNRASVQKPLTLEEELAVLEAFGDEFSDESSDVFGDDEALDELAVLDEVELSPGLPKQTLGI